MSGLRGACASVTCPRFQLYTGVKLGAFLLQTDFRHEEYYLEVG